MVRVMLKHYVFRCTSSEFHGVIPQFSTCSSYRFERNIILKY